MHNHDHGHDHGIRREGNKQSAYATIFLVYRRSNYQCSSRGNDFKRSLGANCQSIHILMEGAPGKANVDEVTAALAWRRQRS